MIFYLLFNTEMVSHWNIKLFWMHYLPMEFKLITADTGIQTAVFVCYVDETVAYFPLLSGDCGIRTTDLVFVMQELFPCSYIITTVVDMVYNLACGKFAKQAILGWTLSIDLKVLYIVQVFKMNFVVL